MEDQTSPSSHSQNFNTEAELQAFLLQWQEEVSARSKQNDDSRRVKPLGTGTKRPRRQVPPSSSHIQNEAKGDDDAPRYHDFEDGFENPSSATTALENEGDSRQQPRSALDHYEKAVERETQGQLGDSVTLYRKAFKAGTD